MRLAFVLLASCSLAGCAVTSFTPPIVRMDQELKFTRQQSTFNAVCSPQVDQTNPQGISETVDGARILIQNFILTYRCQRDRAAEGRQFFEVPQLAIAAAAATAAAFGASAGVAIGAGAAGATLAHAKSYYSPQEKAAIIDHSLDALLCIKTEAVGIDALDIEQLDAAQQNLREAAKISLNRTADDSELKVSASKRYFDLIVASLFSVERVLAQRLSKVGSFDPDGVVSEIERLNQKIRNKGKDPEVSETPDHTAGTDQPNSGAGTPPGTKGTAAPGATPAPTGNGTKGPEAFADTAGANAAARAATTSTRLQSTLIDLDVLRPKLQKCVVRAKM